MERLTKKFTDGVAYCEEIEDVGIKSINSKTYVGKAVEKLAEYEDLEEKGLLLRLPCKVGDTVYTIRKYSYCPSGICHKDISCSECRDRSPFGIYKKKFALKDLKEIGKTIFLTKEEAEQALKQMGSEK